MSSENNTNPFVGLRPFESDESLLFFGRQEQTTELLQRLHQHHFVAIIGSSGSGKSSLIRAGLIPRLKAGYLVNDREQWAITIMKPGKNPLFNLARAILDQLPAQKTEGEINSLKQKIKEEGADAVLAIIKSLWEQNNTNFFLLVDQFEELFRFSMEEKDVVKEDEAIDFVNIMLELSGQTGLPVYVAMTMRSDFMGDCAQFYGLPEAMNKSQYLVPRLNRVELKNAIEGPVKLYKGEINASLTAKLLNDAQVVKDELPLLQHAMMRIWESEMSVDKNGELDLKDYETIGGIEKALSNHADEALKGLTEEELGIVEKMFKALTKVDENGRKIRRPARLKELEAITGANDEVLLKLINRFIEGNKAFLIINKTEDEDDPLIDISHESLIRQWDKLDKWVDEEAEAAKTYLRLVDSYNLYEAKEKDFISGSELQRSLEWYKEFKPKAIWAKRYYNHIETIAGPALMEKKAKNVFDNSKEYLFKSEVAWKRKRRNKIGLIAIALIAVFVLLVLYNIREKARTNEAEIQEKKAIDLKDAFRLMIIAQQEATDDPVVALRIAEAALQKSQDSLILKGAQDIYLHDVFMQDAYYKTLVQNPSKINSVAFSPDGSKVLTSSADDSTVRLWNMNGNLLKEFKGHEGSVYSVVFSPDGNKVLTGSEDNTARLWNVNGSLLAVFKGHAKIIVSVAFSPNGSKVLTGSEDNTAKLWNMNGSLLKEFKGHTAHVWSVAFSPDGSKVLTGSYDNTARLWNVAGSLLKEFKGHESAVRSVTFSPDGRKVLTGSFDRTARLWDINEGSLQVFRGHEESVMSVMFSPDGNKVLTGSYDKTARLWNADGSLLREFKGHKGTVMSVAFSPDGSKVLTGSQDNTARLWNIAESLLKEFKGRESGLRSVAFSPDGSQVLTGSDDSTARLWNVAGSLLKEFKGHKGPVYSVVFSPDGRQVLTSSDDSTARLWNVAGSLLKEFNGHEGPVYSVVFSPDGRQVLTGSDDSTARLWNVAGSLLKQFKGHEGPVYSVVFSPDGSQVLTSSDDSTARLWNMAGGLLKEFKGHKGPVYSVAFSPDGSRVLTGSDDDTVRLWNINGNLLKKFKGHEGGVRSVAFSPDGRKVLTGSYYSTARLWNVDGSLLKEFKEHEGGVRSVAFSPDGSRVLTGSSDGTARLWEYLSLKEFLRSDKIDKLTPEQKKEFGIE